MTDLDAETVKTVAEKTMKWVIDILLPIDDKTRTLSDEVQDMVAREAAGAAVRRIGGEVRVEKGNYAAVSILVVEMKSEAISDYAVSRCLAIYESCKKELFHLCSNDALDAATRMLEHATRLTKMEVIKAVAESGWYGRIEALACLYLQRGLTADEVMALVDNYINNKGIRAEHQEQKLFAMAKLYAPEIVPEVRNKLDKFIQEWNQNDVF